MKNAKRYLAVALSFALFLALPLAFTQEAAAASKTKVTQPSRVISTSTYNNETTTRVEAFAYDNKGLNTLRAQQTGTAEITNKSAYTYNKSGYMTSSTSYYKDKPQRQTIYTVKNGKKTAVAEYMYEDGKASLTGYTRNTYKSGKIAKREFTTPDGKYLKVTTYKKGVPSKEVTVDSGHYDYDKYQTVTAFDKYGYPTSTTKAHENGDVEKTVYKNTYKNGKLVKVASTTAYSWTKNVETGLIVYTYKKGKLVKQVSAVTDSDNPGYTSGYTWTYAYTKGGLIKTESYAYTETTPTETKVTYSDTTAYQYQSVAVDKNCVKAVKGSVEDTYSYKAYLPEYAVY